MAGALSGQGRGRGAAWLAGALVTGVWLDMWVARSGTPGGCGAELGGAGAATVTCASC